jgi:hypothetical protein
MPLSRRFHRDSTEKNEKSGRKKTTGTERIRVGLSSRVPEELNGDVAAREEADDKQHQEKEKQHFRDSCGAGSDPGEAKDGRDQGNDEECNGPIKHKDVLLSFSL